ncbi:lamin tail domain-containing protein [Pseudenhygromyxa sp. WMMC2535]|uniref:lamin tail domain-containing protein n=1 Tax=Pseudenhygromyxa sp. WMMC2535 TaxID=2712867 RepID=UPI0015525E34|nr:lamin tail domain-containing protein [Pseudenhygromyxa sp. WMMC2535]NVB36203.1 lamin tail domain-containing protein [Pseudenhygromyxa sp. WMMC2535]NVB43402.1 lamin tail domain-containing protein [Pseudenhygromyxa sp. WMMC2535]
MPSSTPALGRASRALGLAALLPLACVREPLPEICPVVEEGDLVISELRGVSANASDTFGQYIEVYNAGDHSVDLQGMVIRLRSSGGDELEVFVRESVPLAAGGYAVLGPGDPDDPPTWMDYALGWDISGGDPAPEDGGDPVFPKDLLRYDAAFIELEACEDLIDSVYYAADDLPADGTLACGNAEAPPSAASNDAVEDGACWCVDDLEADPDYPLFGLGLPGTPGRANRCE